MPDPKLQSRFTFALRWQNKDYLLLASVGALLSLYTNDNMLQASVIAWDLADRVSLGIAVPFGIDRALFFVGNPPEIELSVSFMLLSGALGCVAGTWGGFLRDIFLLQRTPFNMNTPYGLCAFIGGIAHCLAVFALGRGHHAWLISPLVTVGVAVCWKQWETFHFPSIAPIMCSKLKPCRLFRKWMWPAKQPFLG